MMSRLIGEIKKKYIFYFFELSPFADLDFDTMISRRTLTASGFKLSQLIKDDE